MESFGSNSGNDELHIDHLGVPTLKAFIYQKAVTESVLSPYYKFG